MIGRNVLAAVGSVAVALVAVVLVGVVGLGASPAWAEPSARSSSSLSSSSSPWLALGLARSHESLTVTGAGGSERDRRAVWHTGPRLGLRYRISDTWPGIGRVRGHTGLALDVVLADGRTPVGVVQEAVWEWRLGPLSAVVGAGAAVHVDLGRRGLAYLDLGLPVGLRWGRVELLYRPRLGVPLAAARGEAFGGTRERRSGAGVALVHVLVRVHLGAVR
ncbi:hypothetical protein [Haliangium sp.]|uniref:hypothetical protein n=1 Tax=Haliangium sp. TaxID=2663208 RepID=UPI003D13C4BF